MAQKPIIHIVADQCETIEFSVVDMMGDEYTWDLFTDSTANFANDDARLDPAIYFEDGDYRDSSSVKVHGLASGRYFVRVMAWDEEACTNNLLVYMLDILEALPEAVVYADSACIGEPTVLKIVLTGKGPWDLIYTFTDETNAVNLYGVTESEITVSLPPLPEGETEVWVMEVVEYNGVCRVVSSNPSERARVVIYPKPTNSKIYLKE